MNIQLIVSLLEAIYLSYTFHFMRTSIDFNMFESSTIHIFKHLVGKESGLRICPFGQIMIVPLILILLLRNFIEIPSVYIIYLLIIATIFALINFNALVYLIPIFIIELAIFYAA